MKSLSGVRLATALVAIGLVSAGCSDTPPPSAPYTPTVSADKGKSVTTATTTLAWKNTLKNDESASMLITPMGGIVMIGKLGLALSFAPGAVSKPVTVTIRAYKGSNIVYGFEPHGLVFNAPVLLTQQLGQTNAYDNAALANTMIGAYVPNDTLDIDASGTAHVTEIFPASTQALLVSGLKKLNIASFNVPHFSGYILSGGIKLK